MAGALWSQVEGLYDHPRGTSGPGIFIFIGTRIANVNTKTPTRVSFMYVAASGAQNKTGAKASQKPTTAFAHAAQERLVRRTTMAKDIIKIPLTMSFKIKGTLL
jgi:hypothetical protein